MMRCAPGVVGGLPYKIGASIAGRKWSVHCTAIEFQSNDRTTLNRAPKSIQWDGSESEIRRFPMKFKRLQLGMHTARRGLAA